MGTKRIKRILKHPPYGKFQGFLAENKIKLRSVADVIGVTVSTVSQKNNGYADYTMSEVNAICDVFGCDPSIFVPKKFRNETGWGNKEKEKGGLDCGQAPGISKQ